MILRPEQEAYLRRLEPAGDPLLAEIAETAAARGVGSVDPALGTLLEILARSTRAGRILEVGTGLGYSTLCLARGAPEAAIVSVDRNPEAQTLAAEFLARDGAPESSADGAGIKSGRIGMVTGEALDTLRDLTGPFDLVLLDADRREYRRHLDLALPLMPVGGTLAAAAVLAEGRLALPPDLGTADEPADLPEDDPEIDALLAFNPYLMIHPQLRSVVLPIAGGVGLATKIRPTIREMGGPY